MFNRVIRGQTAIRAAIFWTIALVGIVGVAWQSGAAEKARATKPQGQASTRSDTRSVIVGIPVIDPARGARLFVTKGCVLCHSVNGVGGRAGPALDAPDGNSVVNIFDFAARMWAGSFAMIELQGMELGYQLEMNGEELGHIAAFIYDKKAQSQFAESDVPDLIKDMIIREPYEPGKGLVDPRK